MNWTLAHIEKLYQQGKIRSYTIIGNPTQNAGFPQNLPLNAQKCNDIPQDSHKNRHKYGSIKTEVDGIVFHSVKEARRYGELKLLRKAGYIGLLEMQVPYELNASGTHSLKYIADFVYWDTRTGKRIVEDVKGFRTREYRKKKKLMKKVHGIEIREV